MSCQGSQCLRADDSELAIESNINTRRHSTSSRSKGTLIAPSQVSKPANARNLLTPPCSILSNSPSEDDRSRGESSGLSSLRSTPELQSDCSPEWYITPAVATRRSKRQKVAHECFDQSETNLEVEKSAKVTPHAVIATSVETKQLADIKQNVIVEKPVDNKSKTVLSDKSSRKTKIWGLTNITITEADRLSQPPPGSELIGLIAEAKRNFQLPNSIDTSVCRYIDGKWLAPQPCHQCHDEPLKKGKTGKKVAKPTCNRLSPCSNCESGNNCSSDGLMVHLRAVSRRALKSQKHDNVTEPQASFNQSIFPLLANHIHQNGDGIWVDKSSIDEGSEGQIARKINSDESVLDNDQTPDETNIKEPATGRKRSVNETSIVQSVSRPRKQHRVNEKATRKQLMLPRHILQGSDGAWTSEEKIIKKLKLNLEPKLKRKKNKGLDFIPDPVSSESQQSDFVPASPDLPRKRKLPLMKLKTKTSDKYYNSVQDNYDEPHGKPPVWADRRQALCEALPYYKAYQSGCYVHNGLARAFMVDKEVGPRDKFTEEVLIARVGGGRKLNQATGQMVQSVDQERSMFGLAFERARDRKQPIAIIAGQGNKISPCKMPHYYNVLDWFHITDVWCELYDGFKTWMVRAEKIDLTMLSWWAKAGTEPPSPDRDLDAFKTTIAHCIFCHYPSKEIYNAGWTCLRPKCKGHFKFADDNYEEIDYNESFMKERTRFTGTCNEPLVPPLITDADMELMDTHGVESICAQGIVCPKCNGCSRRIEWDKWTCEATAGCRFEHRVRQRIVSVAEAVLHSARSARIMRNPAIAVNAERLGRYNVVEYTIPGPEGEVVGIIRHFKSDSIINQQLDGPNDLFREMQTGRFGLKRNPARLKGSTGEILTSHWAANWGAPYKFGVSVLSKGFDEAPPVILKALKRLTWAGERAVTDQLATFVPFNELLSIGYFEDTEIGYHDDGEKELGPTVATLSLGATATMCLRPKAKSNIGPVAKNSRGFKADFLKMRLDHGDIVIMHGPGIQQYYEHAVTPHGKLRFALTCRHVIPEQISNAKERELAITKGSLPIGHEQYVYDGDINAQPVDNNVITVRQAMLNLLRANRLAGHLSDGDITALIQDMSRMTPRRR